MYMTREVMIMFLIILGLLCGLAFSESVERSVKSCSINEWQCGNGSCISSTLRCDGSTDCDDASDERHCRIARSPQGSCVVPEFPNDKTYLIVSSNKENAKPGDSYDHLFINVTCQEGYGVNGSSQFFCIGGQWGPSNQISKCVRQCLLPPSPVVEYQCLLTGASFGLRPCEEREFEGQEVVPTCRAPVYYAPLNLRYMRCQGGSWMNQPLCVPDCGTVTPVGNQLIIDGKNAKRGEVPWHAGIYDKRWTPYKQICGGSIISTQIVLSAAHCFWDEQTGKPQLADKYAVAVGKLYRPWLNSHDDAQHSDVKELHLSDHYKGSTTHHQDDIAVVIVATSIEYKLHVRPVCLDFNNIFQSTQLVPGNKGKIAGWGLTAANGTSSPVLQAVDLPYVDTRTCYADSPLEFHPYITSDKFCAGYKDGGKALCQGDSGGGLAFPGSHLGSTERYYLRGITSTAANNRDLACNPDTYTAFTLLQKHEHFIKRYWVGEDDAWQTQGGSETSSIANCIMPYSNNRTTYKSINVLYAAPGGAYSSIDVEVTCAEGYSLENLEQNSRIGCYNGTWWPSKQLPECAALCRIPNLPGTSYSCTRPSHQEQGFPCKADDFVPSGTVAYQTCDSFYKMESFGSNTVICNDGKWPPSKTRCVGVCSTERILLSPGQFNPRHTEGKTPWFVGVYSKESKPHQLICGGTLISERLVLSAASCFWKDGKQLSAEKFVVGVSKNYIAWDHIKDDDYMQNSDVATIHLPEYFKANPEDYQDDISILLLSKSLNYNHDVVPACLDYGTMGKITDSSIGRIVTLNGDRLNDKDIPNDRADPCYADPPPDLHKGNICVGNTTNILCSSSVGTGWVFTETNYEFKQEDFIVKGIALKKNDCASNFTVFLRLKDEHRDFIYDVFKKHLDVVSSVQGMYPQYLNK